MEGLLPLAVLAGASGTLLFASRMKRQSRRAREGFESVMDPKVAGAFPPSHTDYVQKSAGKFNPIMNLMDPTNNVLLPPNFSKEDVNRVDSNLKRSMRSALAVPNDPSFQLKPGSKKDILMNPESEGTAMAAIKTCEAIKQIDCNAFDKEDFAFNCGVCFKDGQTGSGNPQLGGLFITEDDRASAEAVAKRMNSRKVNYAPSVGKCAPNMFVTTKAQCESLKKQLECQSKQSFDSPGCSTCFQDGNFQYLAPELVKEDPRIVVAGSGTLLLTKVGSNEVNVKQTLSSSPAEIPIPNFEEGDVLQFDVSPATAQLSGYLVGATPSGDFRIDIARLMQTDVVTGSKPRIAGVLKVGDDSYSVMRPGRGKDAMKLTLLNTFTFLETSEQEAITCGSSPFITKETSASFLESNPCFKKGQKPGSYSLDCLQQTFVGAGCSTEGEAYPSTQAKAQALMSGPGGRQLTIGEIGGAVYDKSTVAYTGLNPDGSRMGIQDWDKVSRFCTGKSITSPCDFDNKDGGPLGVECLSYLWKNTGAVENLPGNVGPTYSGDQKVASLNAMNNDRFCTPNGTMAPVDANGKLNADAIRIAQQKGGVAGVKAFYDSIHRVANDNTKTDAERQEAIMQCYGIGLNKVEAQKTDEAADQTVQAACVPTMILDSITNPKPGAVSKPVDVKEDWTLTFTINISASPAGEFWKSIWLLQQNNSASYYQMGFAYDTGVGYVKIRTWLTDGGTYNLIDTPALPLGQDINVTFKVKGKSYSVKLTGAVNWEGSLAAPLAWTGQGMFSVSHSKPGLPLTTATIKNVSYSSCANPYPSVLDYKPGRTKSEMEGAFSNYEDPGLATNFKCPAVELGRFGSPPWGRWWEGVGSFPDDGNAKWIWARPGAEVDEPARNTLTFMKTFTVKGKQPISATAYIWCDNVGWAGLNMKQSFGDWNGGKIIQMTLPPGENLFQINATNQGGPAGVIGILKNNATGEVLWVTDKTWRTFSMMC